MQSKTPQKRVLFVRDPKLVLLGVLSVCSILTGLLFARQPVVAAATDSTINFQARLLTAPGSVVPDGNYNVEFKIYNALTSSGSSQGSCTGDAHCLWTETRTSTNTVQVINGYLTVNLGSVTALPSTINWDQDTYLSMNIGGTGSPTWDGEMSPRLHLTAVPYAFRAGQLAQYNATTGYTSTLNLIQPTGGNQIFNIPDQGAAGTYNLLTANTANANYIQLQGTTPGTAQTGNFNVTGTGIAGVALQTPLLDTAAATTLNIGTTNATAINLNQNVTTATGKTLTVQGVATFQNSADSTGALVVKNAAGTTYDLNVDTTNSRVGFGTNTPSETVDIVGNLQVKDAVTDTKSYRLRTTGSALDFEAAGADMIMSVWSGVNYTGTQYNEITLHKDGSSVAIDRGLTIAGNLYQGGTSVFQTTGSNSYNALQVQNTSGYATLTVSTQNGITTLGNVTTAVGQGIAGQLTLADGTNDNFGAALVTPTLTGNRTITLPDATGTICLQSATACNFAPASGSANYIQLQGTTPGTAQTGNFNVTGTGIAGASLLTPILDTASAGTLNIGSTNATTLQLGTTTSAITQNINIGTNATASSASNVTVGSTIAGTILLQVSGLTQTLSGTADTIQTTTNTATAFRVKASGGNAVFDVDTLNGRLGIGTAAPTADLSFGVANRTINILTATSGNGNTLTLQAGNAAAGNNNGGTLLLQGGAATGSGTGGLVLVKPQTDSVSAFQIQNTSGYNILNVSSLAGTLTLGNVTATSGQGVAGSIVLADGTNDNFSLTLATPTLTASQIITWPSETGTVCTNAASSSVCTFQTAYNHSTGGSSTTPTIKLAGVVGGINLQDGDVGIGGNFLSLRSGNAGGLGNVVFGFSTTGQYFQKPSADSATAFQVQNSSGNTLFDLDSSGGYINLGSTGGATGGTGSAYNGSTTNIENSPNANTTTIIGSTVQSSGSATVDIGYTNTSGGGSIVNIGSGASASSGTTTVQANGALTLTGNGASTWSTTGAAGLTIQGGGGITENTPNSTSANTQAITIQTGNATTANSLTAGTLTLDTGTGTNGSGVSTNNGTVTIGTTNAGTISLGNSSATFKVDAGTTNLGNSGSISHTINIGSSSNATFTQTIKIGNVTSGGTANVTIGGNSGSNAVTIQAGSSGINIGTGTTTGNTIQIGSTNSSSGTQTIAIGNNATSGATVVATLGSTLSTSTTTIQGGGGINLTTNSSSVGTIVTTSTNSTVGFQVKNSTPAAVFTIDTTNGRVYIGSSTSGDTTGYLLVLDNKTNSGDPTGVLGAMYYNSNSQTLRCDEGQRGWQDCLGVPKPNSRRWAYVLWPGAQSSSNAGAGALSLWPLGLGDDADNSGTNGPTNNAATTTDPAMANYSTSTGGTNSIFGNVNYNSSANPDFQTYLKLGATTNERIWAGLTDQTDATMNASSNPAGNYAAFRFDTGAGDANYQCVTKDGTTQTVTSSGIAPGTANGHKLEVIVALGATKVEFKIDGAVVCDNTTHLPSASTMMRYDDTITRLTATNVNLYFAWAYIESDK